MHTQTTRMRKPSIQVSYWLTASFLLLSLVTTTTTTAEQQVSQHQLDQLTKNIKSVDRWLDEANTEKSGLSKQLRKYEKQISRISKDIKQINTKNLNLLKDLKSLKAQLKAQKSSLNQQKKHLVKQLKAVYLQGKQPAIKLLLDSDDPQNLSRYMMYFSYINDARGEKIKQFQASLKALESTETNILKQQSQLNKNKALLSKNRRQLNLESKQRKKVLVKLESNIKSKSHRLEKLKADQVRLEQLLREVEQAIANISLPSDAAPFSQQKSKLPWPTRGKVQERFGSRLAQGKLKANGIRISTKEDAPIRAIHYGRVIFSNWIRGFGLLLIVDHDEGYMSLYGNNKSLLKETGDWIAAGETIAYSGASGGNTESGLYFEIRRNGKPQNPTSWLRK